VADARSRVELIVDAVKALNPLRKVKNETRQLEKAVKDAQNGIRRFDRSLDRAGKTAKRTQGPIDGLTKAVGKLGLAFSVFEGLKFVILKTAELEKQTKSLEVLTGSLEEAKDIISELQSFAAITPFTSSELIEQAKRLKAFGIDTKNLVDVTKRLGDVAGATGADLGGIATAFGQIQAKGRLQGEELLQLQERGVDIAGVLREEYKLSADEFRKALESGRIGADAVNFALIKLTETGGKYANGAISQSTTLAGKFSTLVDNIESIARVIGGVLTPALGGALDILNQNLAALNAFIKLQGDAALVGAKLKLALPGGDVQDLQEVISVLQALPKVAGNEKLASELRLVGKDTLDFLAEYGRRLPEALRPQNYQDALRAAKQLMKVQAEITKPQPSTKPPALLAPRTTGQPKKSPLERQREQLASVLQAERDRASLASALNAEEERAFQLNIDLANIKRQFPELTNQELKPLIEATIQTYERVEASEALKKSNKDRADAEARALKEQQQEAQRLEQIYGQLGQTIATGVTDMLMAAVDGTKSLAEVASNMLKNLANQLLQVAVNTALFSLFPGSSLFKGLPRFADGGSISGGKPSIVGERGPELFMPGRSGSIIPNNAMGGNNIVVNVDATGSNVQGNGNQAKALGSAIGAAVRAELINQQRPGGLLA